MTLISSFSSLVSTIATWNLAGLKQVDSHHTLPHCCRNRLTSCLRSKQAYLSCQAMSLYLNCLCELEVNFSRDECRLSWSSRRCPSFHPYHRHHSSPEKNGTYRKLDSHSSFGSWTVCWTLLSFGLTTRLGTHLQLSFLSGHFLIDLPDIYCSVVVLRLALDPNSSWSLLQSQAELRPPMHSWLSHRYRQETNQ